MLLFVLVEVAEKIVPGEVGPAGQRLLYDLGDLRVFAADVLQQRALPG